jgi:hypothetical protein
MATKETVTIRIDEVGNTVIDADGYQGRACSTATHEIEIAIGGTGKKKTSHKPEFFQAPVGTKQTVKRAF